MPTITQDITLDVTQMNRMQDIVAMQYDKDSRFLRVQLTDNGQPLAVEAGATVSINATRADGASQSFPGEVSADGRVTVPLTYWMLELDDRVSCDVSVTNGTATLSTLGFTVVVVKSNRPGGEVIV